MRLYNWGCLYAVWLVYTCEPQLLCADTGGLMVTIKRKIYTSCKQNMPENKYLSPQLNVPKPKKWIPHSLLNSLWPRINKSHLIISSIKCLGVSQPSCNEIFQCDFFHFFSFESEFKMLELFFFPLRAKEGVFALLWQSQGQALKTHVL